LIRTGEDEQTTQLNPLQKGEQREILGTLKSMVPSDTYATISEISQFFIT